MLVGHRVSLSLILVGVVCSAAFVSLEKKIQSDLRLKKLKELDHQQKYKESSGATSGAHANDDNMLLRRTDVGSYDQREQKHMMPFRRQWLPSTESIFSRRQQESHNGHHRSKRYFDMSEMFDFESDFWMYYYMSGMNQGPQRGIMPFPFGMRF